MTYYVTRTVDDKTMWLVTLPEIITNDSTPGGKSGRHYEQGGVEGATF
ncbi:MULTISPECIES: hypothetical protein [Klebsiella]|nr:MULTISPECIES: hypothetical protein [Klebsiella]